MAIVHSASRSGRLRRLSTNPGRVKAVNLTGALWRKSTRSGNNGGVCVEVASLHHVVAVRDSKDPMAPG